MNPISWQDITPSFKPYQSILDHSASITVQPFIALQPRLEKTLERFIRIQGLTRILLINSTDNVTYRQLVIEAIQEHQLCPVIHTEQLDIRVLFDRYSVTDSGDVMHQKGLFAKAHGGYLVIPANILLANPRHWPAIKSAVQGQALPAINCTPKRITSSDDQICKLERAYNVKLIISGD